jgi:hypothetical protein
MTAATLLAEIIQAGGEAWAEGDRLKFRGVPARLVPLIREHKATLLALLALDDYDRQERAGIIEYDGELPRAVAERLAGIRPAETPEMPHRYQHPTPAPSVRPGASMGPQSAPASVTCGACVRFLPDYVESSQGLGRCTVTPTGLPPRGGSGHGAPYPRAPRRCPEYLGA